MTDRTERLSELKEDKEYEQRRLVDYYYNCLDLSEIPLHEIEEMYKKHNRSLGSRLRTVLGVRESRNYLAKRQALEEAISFQKGLQIIVDKVD